ncbi:MAG TPA: hypothetical protein VK939_09820 [Longimicrobiales bacterium]|nr:hypothetical protein [Longimicrobiales bacterium]
MRLRSFLLPAVAALLLPLPARAQDGPPAGRASFLDRLLVEESAIDFLLAKSAELKLAPELGAKFQEVDARFEEAAKPLRVQIRAKLPRDLGADPEARRAAMQDVRPLTQQLRDLDRQFAEEALALLDTDTRVAAARLLEERRTARMPRRN